MAVADLNTKRKRFSSKLKRPPVIPTYATRDREVVQRGNARARVGSASRAGQALLGVAIGTGENLQMADCLAQPGHFRWVEVAQLGRGAKVVQRLRVRVEQPRPFAGAGEELRGLRSTAGQAIVQRDLAHQLG